MIRKNNDNNNDVNNPLKVLCSQRLFIANKHSDNQTYDTTNIQKIDRGKVFGPCDQDKQKMLMQSKMK